jgi:hypothetical protein
MYIETKQVPRKGVSVSTPNNSLQGDNPASAPPRSLYASFFGDNAPVSHGNRMEPATGD